jgi:hypothetical protein
VSEGDHQYACDGTIKTDTYYSEYDLRLRRNLSCGEDVGGNNRSVESFDRMKQAKKYFYLLLSSFVHGHFDLFCGHG